MSKIKEVLKKNKLVNYLNEKIKNAKKVSITKELKKYYKEEKLNSSKKILLIGHSGGKGGAETLLKNMIGEFLKQDVCVAVLVRGNGPIIEEYKKIAPTFIIDTEEKTHQYIKELSENNFKTSISNTVTTGDLIPTLKKNNIFSINLIHELPGVIKILKCEERAKLIANESDLIVFPSKYVREKYKTITEIKTKDLIQPQGLYMIYDKFDREKALKTLREKHNIKDDNFIILNVGLGEKRKGFDLFYDVAKKLDNKNYTFIWLGQLSSEIEDEFSDKIKKMNNLILPGFINNKDEFMNYYDACDVFLLTSREDPFPSVVLEAFNAERPVVAFENAGGFQDIVRNDISGYLVPYEDTEEMVNKIELLCKDKKLRKKLGKNAKKISEEHKFEDYIKVLIKECTRGE